MNCTPSGLGSGDLSRANDGQLEVNRGELPVAPLRGSVGRYEEVPLPDIEVDMDAVFRSKVVGVGDGARLLSRSAAVFASMVAAFGWTIHKGTGL